MEENEIDVLLREVENPEFPAESAESALAKVATPLAEGALSGVGDFSPKCSWKRSSLRKIPQCWKKVLQALASLSERLVSVESDLEQGLAKLEVSLKEGDLQPFCNAIDSAYTGYLGGAARDLVGKLKDADAKTKSSTILRTFRQFQESVDSTSGSVPVTF